MPAGIVFGSYGANYWIIRELDSSKKAALQKITKQTDNTFKLKTRAVIM